MFGLLLGASQGRDGLKGFEDFKLGSSNQGLGESDDLELSSGILNG